jgi:phosphoribosylanthranilate isomerase
MSQVSEVPGIKNPRVKICCIADKVEADLAIRYGASALGLVAEMPSGPGPIPDETILEIARTVPPPIATFLLTSQTTASGIIDHHARTQTNTIQIVDELTGRGYNDIREALPGVKLVQVIHVRDGASVDEALELAEFVDAILLDSGNPSLAVKELGGTGRKHDWRLSRRIVETIDKPVFLAGGLNAGNVGEAIQTVQPFGLDICSGVRTGGRLDEIKLREFFNEIESACR